MFNTQLNYLHFRNSSISQSVCIAALSPALILAIGMGFGRFGFTGLYPLMVEEGILTLQGGTLAASVNYTGYLLGAILVIRIRPKNAFRLCLWSAAGISLSLASIAFCRDSWLIITLRGISGVFSAMAMVGASVWLLQYKKHIQASPFLYSGIGLGIMLSAELLVIGQHFNLHSTDLWFLLGTISLCIGICATYNMLLKSKNKLSYTGVKELHIAQDYSAWMLVLIYGLAGFGYIITATYLPLFIGGKLSMINRIHIWGVFGFGAMLSCFLWHYVHAILGSRSSLFLNLMIQGIGVVMPVLSPTPLGYLCSAILVGSTFMGFVTIAKSVAQQIAHTVRWNLIALMTTAFGIGQIAGPLFANMSYETNQSFSNALIVASTALIISAILAISKPIQCINLRYK